MPTEEVIIRLFCSADDELPIVNKRSDAHLYPSEIVTMGLLSAFKGGRFRAFHRWLHANDRHLFPKLPEQPAVYAEWRKLVAQFSVSGLQVHDARLVATMLVHSINHILTVNTDDFTRYTSIGIMAVHPTQV